MSGQKTDERHEVRRHRRRFRSARNGSRAAPASLSMWIASLTAPQVLLQRLQSIAPQGKIVDLGIVSATGALSWVLAAPLAGACQVA